MVGDLLFFNDYGYRTTIASMSNNTDRTKLTPNEVLASFGCTAHPACYDTPHSKVFRALRRLNIPTVLYGTDMIRVAIINGDLNIRRLVHDLDFFKYRYPIIGTQDPDFFDDLISSVKGSPKRLSEVADAVMDHGTLTQAKVLMAAGYVLNDSIFHLDTENTKVYEYFLKNYSGTVTPEVPQTSNLPETTPAQRYIASKPRDLSILTDSLDADPGSLTTLFEDMVRLLDLSGVKVCLDRHPTDFVQVGYILGHRETDEVKEFIERFIAVFPEERLIELSPIMAGHGDNVWESFKKRVTPTLETMESVSTLKIAKDLMENYKLAPFLWFKTNSANYRGDVAMYFYKTLSDRDKKVAKAANDKWFIAATRRRDATLTQLLFDDGFKLHLKYSHSYLVWLPRALKETIYIRQGWMVA